MDNDAPRRRRSGALLRPHSHLPGRITLALLLALAAYLLYLLPYQDLPGLVDRLGQFTASLGWYGPSAFALASAVLIAVGVPRLLLAGVAAALFGAWIGLIASQLGALVGAYAIFSLARWSSHEAGLDRWPQLQRFQHLLQAEGILPVLLIRQLPLSSFFINLLLGLTAVRTRDFFIGSLIGFLPGAIPAALIGAGLMQGELADTLRYLLVGVVLLVTLGLLLRHALQRYGRGRLPPEQP